MRYLRSNETLDPGFLEKALEVDTFFDELLKQLRKHQKVFNV